ncbi:hypothetical protein [Brevibacterium zhoupengii]|uniref:hypothetical protein n=1 Tax=Brevibacterium zhoupengii TaxID=2898795 RepID=UPI001F091D9A|nr:hypothetical protein [Brevibacterium zhoupengii]
MAAKLIHAVDTRYSPARKVRVPEEHLKIFSYLKARDPKSGASNTPTQRPAPQVAPPTSEIIKGGK